MNKIINLGILTIFCISLFGLIYAEENLADNYNADTDEIMCAMDVMICPDGTAVSRLAELNCEFAPCPQYDASQEIITNETTSVSQIITEPMPNNSMNIIVKSTIVNTVIDESGISSECINKKKEINDKIKEIAEKHKTELKKLYEDFYYAKIGYHSSLNNLETCRSENAKQAIIQSNNGGSAITGNVAVSSIRQTWIENNITSQPISVNLEQTKEIRINSNDSVSLIELNVADLEKEVIDIVDNDNITTEISCKEQRLSIKESKEYLKLKIQSIKQFREINKEDIKEIDELKKERERIIKECYPQNAVAIKPVCEIPVDLLKKQGELNSRLTELQEELKSIKDLDKEEFIEKYKVVKEDYRYITEKINILKKECDQRNQISQIGLNCQADLDSQNAIQEIKRLLINATNEKEIYELKRKLQYYEERIRNKCGLPITTQSDAVSNTTSQPVLSEAEMYKAEIKKLKEQVKEQARTIESLKSSITEIKLQMQNVGKERKTEILAENAKNVSEHTISILDSRILNLKEKINSIEISERPITDKEKLIHKLNITISELEMYKSKISEVSTAQEFREIISSARQTEVKAIVANKIIKLTDSLNTLKVILEKHYSEKSYYSEYNTQIEQLLTKASDIEVSKEEIDLLIEEYKTLKEEVRTEGRE